MQYRAKLIDVGIQLLTLLVGLMVWAMGVSTVATLAGIGAAQVMSAAYWLMHKNKAHRSELRGWHHACMVLLAGITIISFFVNALLLGFLILVYSAIPMALLYLIACVVELRHEMTAGNR